MSATVCAVKLFCNVELQSAVVRELEYFISVLEKSAFFNYRVHQVHRELARQLAKMKQVKELNIY